MKEKVKEVKGERGEGVKKDNVKYVNKPDSGVFNGQVKKGWRSEGRSEAEVKEWWRPLTAGEGERWRSGEGAPIRLTATWRRSEAEVKERVKGSEGVQTSSFNQKQPV